MRLKLIDVVKNSHEFFRDNYLTMHFEPRAKAKVKEFILFLEPGEFKNNFNKYFTNLTSKNEYKPSSSGDMSSLVVDPYKKLFKGSTMSTVVKDGLVDKAVDRIVNVNNKTMYYMFSVLYISIYVRVILNYILELNRLCGYVESDIGNPSVVKNTYKGMDLSDRDFMSVGVGNNVLKYYSLIDDLLDKSIDDWNKLNISDDDLVYFENLFVKIMNIFNSQKITL